MNQKNIWLRLFNVRSDEVRIVRKLIFLQFFQGAGIAFFLTSALTLLLERFALTDIPFVFVFASVLLWLSGFLYSKLEHKLPLNKLSFIITIFMIASIIFFRFIFLLEDNDSFVFVMLPWFYVLYLLNNLEFWGVASLIFDARQSKRLFGVISAGDIPAKFIGYSIAGLTVHYIGTINLLWAALACMLASLPFLITGKEARILEDHHHHHNKKSNTTHISKQKKPQHNIQKIIKNYSGNALIFKLALLGLLMSVSFLVINFSFWTKVKHSFHDDIALANFIAFFNAIISIVFLFFKLIFTSRLINKLGIIKSLLITPIVMLIMIVIVLLTDEAGNQTIILYCFGATYSIADILKTSINNPVFLTVMQPLPNHERLRAHMILKGITDPFAFLLSGISLLIMINIQGKIDLVLISYYIIVIIFFWLIGVYAVNKQYLKTIVKSISSKFFDIENFSIRDSDTLMWLKSKLKTGTETELLNIISMLGNENKAISNDIIISLLQHPSEKVKTMTLNLMLENNYPEAAQSLVGIIKKETDASLVAKSIKVICKHNIQPDDLLDFLNSENKEIKYATLDGLYFYASGNDQQKAAEIIHQMADSDSKEDRVNVAKILSNHESYKETGIIIKLITDHEADVRKFACIAAGKSKNEILLKAIIDEVSKYEIEMIEPLYLGGEKAVPFIYDYIISNKATALQKEKLIALLGRINSEKAQKTLIGLLHEIPESYILLTKALYRSNYSPRPDEREEFTDIVRKMLSQCAGIIYLQNGLINNDPDATLLYDALDIELNSLKESILLVFAILYNRKNINKVRKAYETGDKNNIINAMEIIDITVRKDLAYRFNILFEPGNIHERIHDVQKIYEAEIYSGTEEIVQTILNDNYELFNDWTISCTLYTAKQKNIKLKKEQLSRFSSSENKMLKETAVFAFE